MFKAVSNRLDDPLKLISDPPTVLIMGGALTLYALSTVMWVVALRYLPLSKAYPFMGLGFVLVPIAAHFIFGDRISWGVVIGALLVFAGIVVASQ